MSVENLEMQNEAGAVARETGRVQAGVTLIEIMIVLAIIGLIMGLLVGPAVLGSLKEAKIETAYNMAKQIEGAYIKWQASGSDSECPASIDDLKTQLGKKKTENVNDPWGQPYIIKCGDQAPEECEGFCVISSGPDKKEGTDDDVKSWVRPRRLAP